MGDSSQGLRVVWVQKEEGHCQQDQVVFLVVEETRWVGCGVKQEAT